MKASNVTLSGPSNEVLVLDHGSWEKEKDVKKCNGENYLGRSLVVKISESYPEEDWKVKSQ